MSDHQKISLAEAISATALNRAKEAQRAGGKSYPCSIVRVSGAMVTVKFEIQDIYTLPEVTMPMMGSQYIRLPLKAGDKGIAIPSDVSIGHISGGGQKVAPKISNSGNLSSLVFMPIGSKEWAAVDNQAVVISAPNGAVVQTDSATSRLLLNATNAELKGSTAQLIDAIHRLDPTHVYTVFAMVEAWLNSHTHNAAGVPTTPAIVPYNSGNIAG